MHSEAHSHAIGFAYLRTWFVGLALACFCMVQARAFDSPSPELETQVVRIQDLAETHVADALNQLIQLKKTLPADAKLADQRLILSALIGLYLNDDQREPARQLNGELSELGKRYSDNFSNALSLNFQADILRDEGKLSIAKDVNEQALQLAKKVNDKKLTRRVYGLAAIITSDMGDFNAALKYQLAAMEVLDSNDRRDDLSRVSAFNNIGTIYLSLKDPKMALDYFDRAIKIAEISAADSSLAMLTLNRGVAYSQEENFPEAIKAFAVSQQISHKISDRRNETLALNNLSDAYYRLGNYPQCLNFAKQTRELAEKLAVEDLQAGAEINVGLCHMGMGDAAQGAREVEHGIDRLRKEDAKGEVEQVMGQLAAAYEKAGLYREAYRAIVEQLKLSSEIFKSDRDRAVAEMKAKYDASEREKQIEVLEQKNQVQSIEIKNKGLQRIVAILSTLIAAAIALTILLLYRKVRETNKSLEEANVKLAHQSTRDPLTGLLNRRAFHDAMKFRTEMTERRVTSTGPVNPPHALVMLDIDHFKRINDTYGHASGDAVLIEISNRLSHVMRDKDMLMRWGGEEFLVFLSHIPVTKLPQVIERILISVGGRPVEIDKTIIPTTISAGYISLPLGTDSEIDPNWEKMLNLADSGLYMAKTRGRNQAVGIQLIGIQKDEIDELSEGNLERFVTEGRVTLEQIAGPAQHEPTTEY